MSMDDPKIACLCPTYKRPNCLRNAAAMFCDQWFPQENRRLYIIDDADQWDTWIDKSNNIYLQSQRERFATIPEKFNAIAELAEGSFAPDIYVVWEDDDAYQSHHLDHIAEAWRKGFNVFLAQTVWSTYEEGKQGMHKEPGDGRFHASLAFTRDIFNKIGGYPDTKKLIFDQMMRSRLIDAGHSCFYDDPTVFPNHFPTYCYRWGNGIYHGSQMGDGDAYDRFYKGLGELAAPPQGRLIPQYDEETTRLIQKDWH